MFNNHNLPKSLINEAANVLSETNADFDLPQQLVEALADAVADYRMCSTFEDRRAIIEWHAEQAIDSEDLDAKDLNNFARAVEYAAVNEGAFERLKNVLGLFGKKRGTPGTGPKAAKAVQRLAARKEARARARAENSESQEDPRYMSTTRKIETGQKVQESSVDYSQLLDVLDSLNESEFNAYLDLLSESEIAALEQILQEAGFLSKAAALGVSTIKGVQGAIKGGVQAFKKSQKNLKDRPLRFGFGSRPKNPKSDQGTAGRDQGTAGRDQGTAGRDQGTAGRDQGNVRTQDTINQQMRRVNPFYDSPYANDIAAAEAKGDHNEAARLRALARRAESGR